MPVLYRNVGDGLLEDATSAAAVTTDVLPPLHRWLQVRLEGTRNKGQGVGARVRVIAGDRVQIAETHRGRYHGTRAISVRGYPSGWRITTTSIGSKFAG